MLQNGEFDAAEVSLSSYLMARHRGAPVIAIPVAPRRLFCQSLFFCRQDAPLRGPEDLIGKRVGINSYQTTLSVLAKGDLAHEYGVPWQSITWVLNAEETFPFTPPTGVRIEPVPPDTTISTLLLEGQVSAVVIPHPPGSIIANRGQVRRLFPDPRQAELGYFQKHGYWPIMHLVALRQDVVERHRWAARALCEAFRQAREKARWHWEDPNWSGLAWGRRYLEEEQALLGGDAWPDGVARNRTNLERFMDYAREQGLISAPLPMEALFHESVLDT
ncbi:MAG: ABC transporter substrate-binding protein [bacterium]